MDDIERLAAVEAITELKARYFRCMDTKEWDGFADVFTSDAEMDVSGEADLGDAGIIRGRVAIVDFVRGAIGDVVTVHHGHMPEITVSSSSAASGVWAMEDMLRWPDGAPVREMHGYGHYHESYVKLDGRWCIASTRLTRLRVDVSTA